MDKLLLWMFIFIIFGIFFLSEQPTLQQARTTSLQAATHLLPGWCYIDISGISCSDLQLTETGIALTINNHIMSFHATKNNLASFQITIPACTPAINASEGLDNQETEIFIFRNCTLGTAGNHWQTPLIVTYEEGTYPNTITRSRKGYISGTITY